MKVYDVPQALVVFVGFVAVAPPWYWFINNYNLGSIAPHSEFIINLLFPAMVLLYLASWSEGRAA